MKEIFHLLTYTVLLALSAMPSVSVDAAEPADRRPNILWITAEDMSPTLGCYGDEFATSPNIDALAGQSTKYSHAFATAPVCSPSRACLINGCIASTQGTHHMRSRFPLPAEMKGFPSLLREVGYYTTNQVKTDYNSGAEPRIIESSWDRNGPEADWRDRPEGEPFFSVINLVTTHQSRTMVWPYEQFQEEIQSQLSEDEINDPADVPVPPYYPDTPLVRKTIARFYDCVTLMDQQVGRLLDRLEQDGLAEDTIVFFYSDHGSGMPRHKRALLDSGMHVPLLVRFPEKYQHLAPTAAGETTNRLVCFEDFAPTALSLAGIESLPEFMRGIAFLGPFDGRRREYVFGHRDRVDEIVDAARSVRSGDYLYIRNYMPHLGYNQQSAWIDQGEVRRDFYALADSGNATPAQRQYLRSSRPREELYHCANDPLNLNNLAESAQHRETLQQMRRVLDEHLRRSRDLGFVPEIELWSHTEGTTPYQWAQTDQYQLDALMQAASLVGTERWQAIGETLAAENASGRYWAAVACSAAETLPEEIVSSLQHALRDSSAAVRIEAAGALARHGHTDASYPVLERLLGHRNPTVLLYAARTVELLGDPAHREPMQRLFDRFEEAPGDMPWFIRFSTTGYLNRLPKDD